MSDGEWGRKIMFAKRGRRKKLIKNETTNSFTISKFCRFLCWYVINEYRNSILHGLPVKKSHTQHSMNDDILLRNRLSNDTINKLNYMKVYFIDLRLITNYYLVYRCEQHYNLSFKLTFKKALYTASSMFPFLYSGWSRMNSCRWSFK